MSFVEKIETAALPPFAARSVTLSGSGIPQHQKTANLGSPHF
jgi:hypothetical protein